MQLASKRSSVEICPSGKTVVDTLQFCTIECLDKHIDGSDVINRCVNDILSSARILAILAAAPLRFGFGAPGFSPHQVGTAMGCLFDWGARILECSNPYTRKYLSHSFRWLLYTGYTVGRIEQSFGIPTDSKEFFCLAQVGAVLLQCHRI